MNCRDFEMNSTAFARSAMLDGITREQCLAHTETCARCAARLACERTLLAGVQAVVGELADERASLRVEAALLLAFHERSASGSGVLQMPQKRDWAVLIWAAAAAAVLALVSTVVVSRLQATSPNETRRAESPSSETPSLIAPSSDRDTAVNPDKNLAGQRRAVSRRRSIRHSQPGASEIATDFMPLLEGDDLASLDSSQLVRVELPGSALIAVGLPVDPEMADAPVKADVLLGHDGLARAIRFVR
jgi:hypothetical protein